MKRILFCFSVLFLSAMVSCQRGPHFISDSACRSKVDEAFNEQKELAKNRSGQLFGVFDKDLSRQEKEALKFLYAYMPLSDLADYDGEFYLQNVRVSLAARDTFTWGKTVPENLFRHFVLPIRVNNENLDTARGVFFHELKDRIKRLSMKEAALEVNHWCHEKVTYRGSDIRTSSPLATVMNAYGRCGEESTFTVAALRSVAIPARQCYTPRWAHCDDNHAWVEVWVDGRWHFLGACEPEPDLDLAWFAGPAKRAMLVNTNVFGDYEGPEEVLVKDPRYTRINVLSNYTETKKIFVSVRTEEGIPADSASVEFQLYNYAEFYPLQRCNTDANGLCSFTTGLGDLLVWAAKNDRFGYRKISILTTDTLVIRLDRKAGGTYEEVFDFVPPPEKQVGSSLPDSVRERNTRRFAFEDRVRAAYESTFIDSSKTQRLAVNLKMNGDTLWQILHKSRGNWRTLIDFVSSVQADKKPLIFPLLLSVSEKDLHDITQEVLRDAIGFSRTLEPAAADKSLFNDYILSPRIDNEFLKPSRDLFQKGFDRKFIGAARKDPRQVAQWILANIILDEKANYGRAPLTPRGVFELKVSDPHSRDLLFVSVCRSFGIPARLEPALRIPQYYAGASWHDIHWEPVPEDTGARVRLTLNTDPGQGPKPEYYIHFTIEKYDKGFFRSLDYETDPVLKSFPCTIEVPHGSYMLVTGNRIPGGTVLTKLSFFDLGEDRPGEVKIELRKTAASPPVLGKINGDEALIKNIGKSGLSVKNSGLIIAWIDPEKEPSRHFTADLIRKKAGFNQWKGNILLLFNSGAEKDLFLSKNISVLPERTHVQLASDGSLDDLMKILDRKQRPELPAVIFINPKGEITFFSEGYRIGIGDEILGQIAPGI